ncbi:MAG TPA: amidase [Rhizomicrobium sp.]|jgi:aspartyl-tRNA(Asn)/glutamyl-tRNA(Gln) amidotransferase subunit A|nr:amidase [Rhizomicrobium sp.]
MPKEPHEMNAPELSRAFHDGDLSPVEVTGACLARIEALDAEINAFCLIDAETSLRQAEESEKRWEEGNPLSPLDGVPAAVKDLLLTKGWPTLRGSRTVDPKTPWNEDAPCVARLREAGAVLIGKTTTPEFGWKGSTDNTLTGVTRNPWNKSKTPGGSSGGSGAALAARFCPLALGTDGGGSIRIPASFSGLFGLKPSFGRVPAYPLSPFGTVAHVGPMSRDVRGSAMLMNVMSKPDARDWFSLPYETTDYAAELDVPLRGKRIAFSPRLGYAPKVDAEVETLVAATVKRLEELGAHVEQVDPPGGDPSEIFRTLWWSGAAFLLGDLPEEKKALLDPGLRQMAEEGKAISAKEYLAANLARGNYGSALRVFMERYDFIVTPTLATTAFDTGLVTPMGEDGKAWLSWSPFSYPFNLTQQPAASVPCGFTKDSMPVGLQIVGRMFDDQGVLAAAAAYERADPHFEATPQGF